MNSNLGLRMRSAVRAVVELFCRVLRVLTVVAEPLWFHPVGAEMKGFNPVVAETMRLKPVGVETTS